MGAVDGELAASGIDRLHHGRLAGRQLFVGFLAGGGNDDGVLQVFENHVALDREIECCRRQRGPALTGKAPVVDVIDERR